MHASSLERMSEHSKILGILPGVSLSFPE